jgi:hypothetical protein
MSEGNGTVQLAPYVQCEGCRGTGLVRARVDAESRLGGKDQPQVTAFREHGRCNGAGIRILRQPQRGEPYYGAPKLS